MILLTDSRSSSELVLDKDDVNWNSVEAATADSDGQIPSRVVYRGRNNFMDTELMKGWRKPGVQRLINFGEIWPGETITAMRSACSLHGAQSTCSSTRGARQNILPLAALRMLLGLQALLLNRVIVADCFDARRIY